MDRRTLLKNIAILTSAAVAGAEVFLTGCKRSDAAVFSDADIALFDEIAEIIIPETDTPGAKAAQVGRFMVEFIADCYSEEDLNIVKNGLMEIDRISRAEYGKNFVKISPQQRYAILQKAALEARTNQEKADDDTPTHYFTLLQQSTLLGYFTSEIGYTQVLRYEIIPGRYTGCIDYAPGEKAWANY